MYWQRLTISLTFLTITRFIFSNVTHGINGPKTSSRHFTRAYRFDLLGLKWHWKGLNETSVPSTKLFSEMVKWCSLFGQRRLNGLLVYFILFSVFVLIIRSDTTPMCRLDSRASLFGVLYGLKNTWALTSLMRESQSATSVHSTITIFFEVWLTDCGMIKWKARKRNWKFRTDCSFVKIKFTEEILVVWERVFDYFFEHQFNALISRKWFWTKNNI